MNVRLVQFARAPVAGAVKTRLLPALSPQQACEVHRQLVAHTTGQLLASSQVELTLYTDDISNDWMRTHAQQHGIALVAQVAGDLGARMLAACRDAPLVPTLLVGSDCPALDEAYLRTAIAALGQCDVVIGPARDGGYVLLGAQQPYPALFEHIDWGSDRVLAQTLSQAERSGLSVQLLNTLDDIDRPEDLGLLAQYGITLD